MPAQIAATAHPLEFLTVAGGGTATCWMDSNLGASQVATSATDTTAYGDYYQWGRAADGHQISTSTTATLAPNFTPNHAQFITIDPSTPPNDWTAAGVDDNGEIRQALWSRTDGSSICPTGFRVPTTAELLAEVSSWSSTGISGAFASDLKWTYAGSRFFRTGAVSSGFSGSYWSRAVDTVVTSNSAYLSIGGFSGTITFRNRSRGHSIRCIQN